MFLLQIASLSLAVFLFFFLPEYLNFFHLPFLFRQDFSLCPDHPLLSFFHLSPGSTGAAVVLWEVKSQHGTATSKLRYLKTLFSIPFLVLSSYADLFCLFLNGKGSNFYQLSWHTLKTQWQVLYTWKFTRFCAPVSAELVPKQFVEESETLSVLYTSIKPQRKTTARETQMPSLMCLHEITTCNCCICRCKTVFNSSWEMQEIQH